MFDNTRQQEAIASLSENNLRGALYYLKWLHNYWTGPQRWFQGIGAAPGRKSGGWNRVNAVVSAHCLVTPYAILSEECMKDSMKVLGFIKYEDAVDWNNDSETTFEMVKSRVGDAIKLLEASLSH